MIYISRMLPVFAVLCVIKSYSKGFLELEVCETLSNHKELTQNIKLDIMTAILLLMELVKAQQTHFLRNFHEIRWQ